MSNHVDVAGVGVAPHAVIFVNWQVLDELNQSTLEALVET